MVEDAPQYLNFFLHNILFLISEALQGVFDCFDSKTLALLRRLPYIHTTSRSPNQYMSSSTLGKKNVLASPSVFLEI